MGDNSSLLKFFQFGLLGSLGRGVPLFRGKSGLDQDFSAPDVNSGLKHGYEKKTEGLRKFELREQKLVCKNFHTDDCVLIVLSRYHILSKYFCLEQFPL